MTMNLLDLPPELIGRILELSTAPDFENLMVTCKAVYACGTSILASHNDRRRQWSRFIVLDQDPRESWALVYRNMAHPNVAEYARFADFRAATLSVLNNNMGARSYELSASALQDLGALVSCMQFLPEAVRERNYLPYWLDRVAEYPNTYASDILWDWSLILLITQLKYVTRLTLPSDWLDTRGFMAAAEMGLEDQHKLDLLTALTIIMRGTHKPEADAPLACCKIIRSLGLDATPTFLSSMSPLLAMKSVAEFHATGLFGQVENSHQLPSLPYTWPYADLKSPLQRLELLDCNIDGESLGALLAHTPYLRVFRYSHVPEVIPDRPFYWDLIEEAIANPEDLDLKELAIEEYRRSTWNVAAFVDTIAKYCGNQLIELAITFGDRCKKFGIKNPVTNMKDFTRLEHAELEVAIFGSSDDLPTFTQLESREINVPKLVEILPSSLKTLQLFDGFQCEPEAVVALMRDFAAGRDWLLSDLEEISYRYRDYYERSDRRPYYSAIERQADAQGISYSSGPSIQPHWTRAFGKDNGVFNTA